MTTFWQPSFDNLLKDSGSNNRSRNLKVVFFMWSGTNSPCGVNHQNLPLFFWRNRKHLWFTWRLTGQIVHHAANSTHSQDFWYLIKVSVVKLYVQLESYPVDNKQLVSGWVNLRAKGWIKEMPSKKLMKDAVLICFEAFYHTLSLRDSACSKHN